MEYLLDYREEFGMFPEYLRLTAKVLAYSSTVNYISKIKGIIENKQPETNLSKNTWYHDMRHQVTKKIFVRCC